MVASPHGCETGRLSQVAHHGWSFCWAWSRRARTGPGQPWPPLPRRPGYGSKPQKPSAGRAPGSSFSQGAAVQSVGFKNRNDGLQKGAMASRGELPCEAQSSQRPSDPYPCPCRFCGECLQPCLQVPSPLCPLCRLPFDPKKVDKAAHVEKQLSSYKAPCRGCNKKVPHPIGPPGARETAAGGLFPLSCPAVLLSCPIVLLSYPTVLLSCLAERGLCSAPPPQHHSHQGAFPHPPHSTLSPANSG